MYFVIDIGSNTIRAVVFRLDGNKLIPVLNKKYSAGLAGYVDEDDLMSEEGILLCLDILGEIKIIIDAFDFDGVYPFATASLRNVKNSREIVERIEKETGLTVKVLTGNEEAYFDYYGTVQSIPSEKGILADIGGGSTEIVLYHDSEALVGESLNFGSLTMYNRFVDGLIPTKKEIKAIQEEATSQLEKLHFRPLSPSMRTLCGVGGTARAALKLYNLVTHQEKGNDVYPVEFLSDLLSRQWEEEKMTKLILKTSPDRIHTLIPGMAILSAIGEFFHAEKVITSSHGVREGYYMIS